MRLHLLSVGWPPFQGCDPLLKGNFMFNLSFRQRAGHWLAAAALFGAASFLGAGMAHAQAEPTIKQIYETAQTGKIEQAQTMVQQVLIAHPNSAKAYFVQAELFARQGEASRGREALVKADKLAPGLPFAKPEAVLALRTQLATKAGLPAAKDNASRSFGLNAPAAPAPAAASFPVGWALALGAGALALVVWLIRKKTAASAASTTAYPGFNSGGNPGANTGANTGLGGGLSGPQTFGTANNGSGAMAAGYPQPGYGQAGYGQPAASGMGGRVMGGLATGLAVGAGVMAAQAIGKNLMGNNEHPAHPSDNAGNAAAGSNAFEPLPGNNDLGGQNFGLNDTSSWDNGGEGGMADAGGGGDWDT